MLRLTVSVNFTILAIYSSLSLSLMIRNDKELMKYTPQCSVTVRNQRVDCEINVNDVTDCCTDEQHSSPQHSYQQVNNTAITFTLSLESIHMFYLTKGCNISTSYCIAIYIHVPMELQMRSSEAIVHISNLPDLYKGSKEGYGLILRKTNVFVSGWDAQSFQRVHTACEALYNTSMYQHVRSDSVELVARPSPGLSDQLAAELVKLTCNVSCTADEALNCNSSVVQVKEWSKINEPLLFSQLASGSFYCVIVRHWDHLNCAIFLRTFEYRAPKELALSELEIPKKNVNVILGLCSLFVALSLVFGAMLLGSFVRERGMRFIRRLISQTANPISSTASLTMDLSMLRNHSSSVESSPLRILLLYSRDSPELCQCMKALSKVLSLSTDSEVLDPLNDVWGIETEKYRDAGLSSWLYAVLRSNCSVVLLMTPGGKMRQSAIEKYKTVVFDPPNMLDDIFLLGFDYIKTQMSSDYKNVLQISFEGAGNTGETYNIGVPLAKYILPLRLRELISALRRDTPRFGHEDLADDTHHFYGCDEYGQTIMRFQRSLEDLKNLYAKNPQYMDRTLVSTVNMCSERE